MRAEGEHRQRVKEFVEAEMLVAEVGLLERIEHGAGDVQDAPDADQDGRRDAGGEELRQVEQRSAAEGDVDGHVQPARGVGPQEAEQDAENRAGPDDPEQQDGLGLLQQRPGKRRVAAGDDQHDVGVVQPFEDHLDAGGPVSPVVDGADSEKQHARGGVDGRGDLAVRCGGHGHQDDACHQRQRCRDGVDPATPLRLDHQEFGQPDRGVIHRAMAVRSGRAAGVGSLAVHASRISSGAVSYSPVTEFDGAGWVPTAQAPRPRTVA